jgi:hypothetical protein
MNCPSNLFFFHFLELIAVCKKSKPSEARACELLTARMDTIEDANSRKEFTSTDEWRDEVLGIIQEIFHTACSPMLNERFGSNVNRVLKGYLTDYINGEIVNLTVTYCNGLNQNSV